MANKEFHLEYKTTILVNRNNMHATFIYKTKYWANLGITFVMISSFSHSLTSEADNKISEFLLLILPKQSSFLSVISPQTRLETPGRTGMVKWLFVLHPSNS